MKIRIAFGLLALSLIWTISSYGEDDPNVVVLWNQAALQGVRDSTLGPPMVARALAIVHTCIYDAWAAYDKRAVGTQFGGSLRRPTKERTLANKNKAISFAAYRAVLDLLPATDKATVFDVLMTKLGYDIHDVSVDTRTPSGIGNAACNAVIAFRHYDGSNRLGTLANPGAQTGMPYADYTGYTSVNPSTTVPLGDNWSKIVDPDRWQPLTYFNGMKVVTQAFVGAQWSKVIPFALKSQDQFSSFISKFGPALHDSDTYRQQALDLIALSAGLTDEQKMIAEYWANGPHSELPPGHWDLFAQFVSARDHHGVDDDAKMFFALTNAIFDAGIACWDAKIKFDSVRPVTAIPYLFHGQQIQAWGGPGKGTMWIDGKDWIPYQVSTFPTPPFPEYISGHSTFSAAGAEILKRFTHSDRFGGSWTFAAGTSVTEPGITPAQPVTLSWETFTDAANQAGISRRYGGIHFELGDLVGRATGRLVAAQAWEKAQSYFNPEHDHESRGDAGDDR
ncbi:MAG TPA: vanadium-dependent haloperoxidase [Terriglobales bacterium]|nr:vanadium-dependent haloperoxidase [Terriglobales bacterium]